MNLYLDNNILIDIEKGLLSIRDIQKNLEIDLDKIYFSAAHIQEALEMTGDTDEEKNNRILKRFDTISNICKMDYLHEDMNNRVSILQRKPEEVYDTLITTHSFANNAMKGLISMIPESAKESVRVQLGLNPILMNNYTPLEVTEHLKKKFSEFGQNGSILELLEQVKNFHPDGKSFGLSNDIAGVFEFLDMVGYWKDKVTSKSNYARLWDSNHTFFAAHCNYFISDDKRTRNKAKVAYHLFGISTKVLSSKGEE
ncbi:MAG: hypothetical protein JXR48_04155 [Candidatus Delongbacteria bacterium]|nr:hypothetical protein [Candidatus Delongbacteria bacterium]